MITPPLKHLTNNQIQAFLATAEAGGSLSSALCAMSQDEQDELYGIALYGQSKNNFDFQWHLDHVTDAAHQFDLWVRDVQEGLRRLGIDLDNTVD